MSSFIRNTFISSSKAKQKAQQHRQTEAESSQFLKNGSDLLEELIVSFNGRHNIPIRSFTIQELTAATDGFSHWIMNPGDAEVFKGTFQNRPILVRNRLFHINSVHDIVITSQMSHHKNVLKLLGCCLESKIPSMVYEFNGTELFADLLYGRKVARRQDRVLSWKARLNIAKAIANVMVYLHTAFIRPIIHRSLKAHDVIIDENNVAKLFDFSLCVMLPPGETHVQDRVINGKARYVDPEYCRTGIATEKVDVYGFGILLLQILFGEDISDLSFFMEEKNVDPEIWGRGVEEDHQIQACLALALDCVKDKGDDRPRMIEVARELAGIQRRERSVCP